MVEGDPPVKGKIDNLISQSSCVATSNEKAKKVKEKSNIREGKENENMSIVSALLSLKTMGKLHKDELEQGGSDEAEEVACIMPGTSPRAGAKGKQIEDGASTKPNPSTKRKASNSKLFNVGRSGPKKKKNAPILPNDEREKVEEMGPAERAVGRTSEGVGEGDVVRGFPKPSAEEMAKCQAYSFFKRCTTAEQEQSFSRMTSKEMITDMLKESFQTYYLSLHLFERSQELQSRAEAAESDRDRFADVIESAQIIQQRQQDRIAYLEKALAAQKENVRKMDELLRQTKAATNKKIAFLETANQGLTATNQGLKKRITDHLGVRSVVLGKLWSAQQRDAALCSQLAQAQGELEGERTRRVEAEGSGQHIERTLHFENLVPQGRAQLNDSFMEPVTKESALQSCDEAAKSDRDRFEYVNGKFHIVHQRQQDQIAYLAKALAAQKEKVQKQDELLRETKAAANKKIAFLETANQGLMAANQGLKKRIAEKSQLVAELTARGPSEEEKEKICKEYLSAFLNSKAFRQVAALRMARAIHKALSKAADSLRSYYPFSLTEFGLGALDPALCKPKLGGYSWRRGDDQLLDPTGKPVEGALIIKGPMNVPQHPWPELKVAWPEGIERPAPAPP